MEKSPKRPILALSEKGRGALLSTLNRFRLLNVPPERRSISAHLLHLKGKFRRYLGEPRLMLAEWGLIGARIVGTSAAGNTLLRLSRNYELGPRGTVIELPRDRVIFESVRQEGSYSPEISQFISEGLETRISHKEKSAFLDIGANCGLVTLQIVNQVQHSFEYHLFEPLPQHVQAIRHNLMTKRGSGTLHIHDFALSDRNGRTRFYTEKVNFGNSSSLQNSIVNRTDQIVTEVPARDTAEFFEDFEKKYSRFFIKSDTQGMDALVLARLPRGVWKKVERATIEILALPDINPKDVADLVAEFSNFRRRSWDAGMRSEASLAEIGKFWSSGSGLEKNLFLIK